VKVRLLIRPDLSAIHRMPILPKRGHATSSELESHSSLIRSGKFDASEINRLRAIPPSIDLDKVGDNYHQRVLEVNPAATK